MRRSLLISQFGKQRAKRRYHDQLKTHKGHIIRVGAVTEEVLREQNHIDKQKSS